MISKFYLPTIFISAVSMIASCGGDTSTNETANKNANANSNVNSATVANKAVEPTTNNAPTLGAVVQQYNEALKTKNDQMLRDTITADLAKSLEADMKEAKRKDFAAFVAEQDNYQPGQVIEVRNEKINGNKGVAQLKGGQYKVWTAFSFALENGKWRLDNGSPELDNMPPSNANSAR